MDRKEENFKNKQHLIQPNIATNTIKEILILSLSLFFSMTVSYRYLSIWFQKLSFIWWLLQLHTFIWNDVRETLDICLTSMNLATSVPMMIDEMQWTVAEYSMRQKKVSLWMILLKWFRDFGSITEQKKDISEKDMYKKRGLF